MKRSNKIKLVKGLLFSALITFIFGFGTGHANAAKKVNLRSAKDFRVTALNKSKGISSKASALGLSSHNELKLVRAVRAQNGIVYSKYQQYFEGVPVWGERIAITSKNSTIGKVSGKIVKEITDDVKGTKPAFDSKNALKEMKKAKKFSDKIFKNEKSRLVIYVDDSGEAHLAYFISFFADAEEGGKPTRPHYLVDAKTRKVLKKWEGLAHAEVGTGPGGNEKTGYYEYGDDYGYLDVTVIDGIATMETPNVRTIDLMHGTSGDTAYSFSCCSNTHKAINGGFCPLNDAHYFGEVVYNLYKDWVGVPPLNGQLKMKVHYSSCYDNAFWDGESMSFGDGCETFYPLVSLDVIAHEVSHGFTEQNSGLVNFGQSGGINEAFSDIAGEAAEYYMHGSCDFKVGAQIFKAPGEALRYMYDPTLDEISIGCADDYYEGMDVHRSSGVFNKAFYLLATTAGWDVHMAFNCFVGANQNYWTQSTTFVDGAQGVVDMAGDLGYPVEDVQRAFMQVCIPVNMPAEPVADFSSPTDVQLLSTVTLTDRSQNYPESWNWTITPDKVTYVEGTTCTSQNPKIQFNEIGAYTITLDVANSFGSDSKTKPDYVDVIELPCYSSEITFYEWINATEGTSAGLIEDDDLVSIPIGFNFRFFYATHNTVTVSSNGYLTFGTSGSAFNNTYVPSASVPNDLIAPFWDDLNPSSEGSVYYLLDGLAPNRRMTIEWYNVPHFSNMGGATFQVTLYEGSNEIVFQYQDVTFGNDSYNNGASATVGIENGDGSDGIGYSYNQPVIQDGMAIRFYVSPPASDDDGDNLGNAEEEMLGTNPHDTDSDNDGLNDGEDLNPLNPDANFDGVMDY